MLDGTSRDAVDHWRDKADIVLIDQDSTVAIEGCVLSCLTGKFEREGYTGKLWFVVGGQAAVEDQECVQCVCEEGRSDANRKLYSAFKIRQVSSSLCNNPIWYKPSACFTGTRGRGFMDYGEI